MTDIFSSWHFVDEQCVPRIDASRSMEEVIELSHFRSTGAVCVTRASPSGEVQAVGYLRLQDLTESIDGPVDLEDIVKEQLDDLIETHGIRLFEIQSVDSSTDAELLSDRTESIAFAVQRDGQPAGWFLNHEEVRIAVDNKPPVYLCEKEPDPHRNSQWNDGDCTECFRKIRKRSGLR